MTDFDETDEELDEELDREFDFILALLEACAKLPKRDGDYKILNLTREQDADAIEKMFRETAEGKIKIFNGKTEYTFDAICVEASGKEIWFNDTKAFAETAERADNFEICSKVDKTVEIDFCFWEYKKVGNIYDDD